MTSSPQHHHPILLVAALAGGAIAGSVLMARKSRKERTNSSRVGVGVGAVLVNAQGEFLMGLRKGSHGANTWALPGGWLETGEEFENCAVRELQEETGLAAEDLGIPLVVDVAPSNNIMKGVHSVSVFVMIPLVSDAVPRVMEPNKCEKWQWFAFAPDQWPENLFPSAKHLLFSRAFTDLIRT